MAAEHLPILFPWRKIDARWVFLRMKKHASRKRFHSPQAGGSFPEDKGKLPRDRKAESFPR